MLIADRQITQEAPNFSRLWDFENMVVSINNYDHCKYAVTQSTHKHEQGTRFKQSKHRGISSLTLQFVNKLES